MSETLPMRMTTPPLVGWINDFNDFATRRLTAPIDFVIRVWLAQSFFRLGILKSTDPEPTVWLFTFVQPIPGVAPETAASVLTAIELVAPILLVLGLSSRLAALALLLSAALLHKAYPAVPDHLYTMLLLAITVIRGPGQISLDSKFFPSLVSSALPLTNFARRLGSGLSDYIGPVYQAVLRIWMAVLLGMIGYSALAGMDPTTLALVKRYGVTLMEPSTGFLALAAAMVFFAGLLALGVATR